MSVASVRTHCALLGKLVCVELAVCGPLLIPCNPALFPQLLEVNKQWDQHFRSMKQQYEQKVVWELREVKAESRELSCCQCIPPAAVLLSSVVPWTVTLTHSLPLPLNPDH